jgi:hypothetical protein
VLTELQTILARILTINANYTGADNSTAEDATIQKRQVGDLHCANFATGDAYDIVGEILQLRRLGGQCAQNGHGFIRMRFKNTSGIFVSHTL